MVLFYWRRTVPPFLGEGGGGVFLVTGSYRVHLRNGSAQTSAATLREDTLIQLATSPKSQDT